MEHERHAKPADNRALMMRSYSHRQHNPAEFDWPFQISPEENNCHFKVWQCASRDSPAKVYSQCLSLNLTKDEHLAVGMLICRRQFCLSDEAAVIQAREHSCQQYALLDPIPDFYSNA
jgi:hypothetical protein